jgi:hypothetical protein
MLTKVKFRGPILFVHKGDELVDARIPDANHHGTHKDGSIAKKHHAVLMLKKENGKNNDYKPLPIGSVVSIVGKNARGKPKLALSFKNKISLSKMANAGALPGQELKLNGDLRKCVHVDILGGSVSATSHTQDAFPIPAHWSGDETEEAPPLLTVWTCTDGFTLDVNGKDVKLDGVEDVYIFNWENDKAGHKELENNMCRVNDCLLEPELDFRWLYELLVPPNDWPSWIGQGVGKCGKMLPAPWSSIESQPGALEPAYPPNSACDGARWGDV